MLLSIWCSRYFFYASKEVMWVRNVCHNEYNWANWKFLNSWTYKTWILALKWHLFLYFNALCRSFSQCVRFHSWNAILEGVTAVTLLSLEPKVLQLHFYLDFVMCGSRSISTIRTLNLTDVCCPDEVRFCLAIQILLMNLKLTKRVA